jgi:hypothetical protein
LPPRHHVRGCPYTLVPVGFQFGFLPDQMPDLLECRYGRYSASRERFFGPLMPEVNTNSQTAAAGRRWDSCQTRRPSTPPESSFCFSVKLQTADRRNRVGLPTPRAASRGGDFIELTAATAQQQTKTRQQAGLQGLTLWVYAYVSVYLSVLYALVCACSADVMVTSYSPSRVCRLSFHTAQLLHVLEHVLSVTLSACTLEDTHTSCSPYGKEGARVKHQCT